MNAAKIRNFYFNLKKNACGCDGLEDIYDSEMPQELIPYAENQDTEKSEENSLEAEIDSLEHEMVGLEKSETPEDQIQNQKQSIVREIKKMFFNLNKIENMCSEINSMKPVLTQIVMSDSFQDLDTVIDEITSKINIMYDFTNKMREIDSVSETLTEMFFPYPN